MKSKLNPNPVSDKLMISSNSILKTNQVDIVDVTGKVLKKVSLNKDMNSNFIEVDLVDLKSGIYFLKIRNKKETITKQIIKQ